MLREKLGAQERSRPRQSSAESAPLAGRQTDAHHQNQNYRRKRATPSEAAYLARRIVPEQPFICCGQKLVTAHRQTAVLHTSVIFAAPTNPNSESINQSKQTNRKKKNRRRPPCRPRNKPHYYTAAKYHEAMHEQTPVSDLLDRRSLAISGSGGRANPRVVLSLKNTAVPGASGAVRPLPWSSTSHLSRPPP